MCHLPTKTSEKNDELSTVRYPVWNVERGRGREIEYSEKKRVIEGGRTNTVHNDACHAWFVFVLN